MLTAPKAWWASSDKYFRIDQSNDDFRNKSRFGFGQREGNGPRLVAKLLTREVVSFPKLQSTRRGGIGGFPFVQFGRKANSCSAWLDLGYMEIMLMEA